METKNLIDTKRALEPEPANRIAHRRSKDCGSEWLNCRDCERMEEWKELESHEHVQQLKDEFYHEWDAEEGCLDWKRIEMCLDRVIRAVLHVQSLREVGL